MEGAKRTKRTLLFLSGNDGFTTLETALALSQVIAIVLPVDHLNHEIKSLAELQGIPVIYRPETELLGQFDSSVDAVVVSGFPYRLMSHELALATDTVNIHAGILPKYRGRHGGIWAMINGERFLGVTLHRVDEKFDNGDTIAIRSLEVTDSMTRFEIIAGLRTCHVELLRGFLTDSNTWEGETDPPKENIYWRKRTIADSEINWHCSAAHIVRFVRALSRPQTVAWSKYEGIKFHFWSVEPTGLTHAELPGTVIQNHHDTFVCAGDGYILKVLGSSSETGLVLKQGMVLH